MLPSTSRIIMQYVAAARAKHGRLTTDLQRAHLVMSEEMGEFTKEVADKTRVHEGHQRMTDWAKVEHELMQTLAVGVEVYENIQQIKQEMKEAEGKVYAKK